LVRRELRDEILYEKIYGCSCQQYVTTINEYEYDSFRFEGVEVREEGFGVKEAQKIKAEKKREKKGEFSFEFSVAEWFN